MCGTCILRFLDLLLPSALVYVDRDRDRVVVKILTRLGQKLDEEVSVSVFVKI